jgi:hypothetical protein
MLDGTEMNRTKTYSLGVWKPGPSSSLATFFCVFMISLVSFVFAPRQVQLQLVAEFRLPGLIIEVNPRKNQAERRRSPDFCCPRDRLNEQLSICVFCSNMESRH